MTNSFTDGKDREWTPRVSVGLLCELARGCGVTLAQMADPMSLTFDVICEAVWLSVRGQARERHMSRDEFMENMSVGDMMSAMGAWAAAFSAAASRPEDRNVPFEGLPDVSPLTT
jgi:hypothetical protein